MPTKSADNKTSTTTSKKTSQRALFARNLSFLKQFQPPLGALLANHQPSELQSAPDLSNDIRHQGQPFYGMDGKHAAQLQVQHFMQAPTHFSLTYRSIPGNRYLHQDAINQLNQHAAALHTSPTRALSKGKPNISNLIALGSGLGFQITALRQHMAFANVIIVEPNTDMLWHLLHFLDLAELSDHCLQSGGHLSIVQPRSYQDFSSNLTTLAARSGFAMFAELSVFRHYETPLFDKILENIQSLRNQQVSAWGFINDEYIGLKNSLANRHLPFINHALAKTPHGDNANSANNNKPRPVIMVGNGPSLDKDLPLLIKSRQHFTLISCGTALGTLIKNQIMPDFHAEMERSSFTASVQQVWLTDNVCERVTLLALNTVSPEITHRFKRVILFPKGNDIGTQALIRSTAAPSNTNLNTDLKPLKYCNPTVTNFALTAACALNITKLIMLGCDYGFRSQQHHHAQQSEYFNQSSRLANIAPKADLQVDDNHGGKINSSRIFTLSRENVEAALQRNPQMQVTNCSDGAKIKHTSWQPFEQIVSEYKQEYKQDTHPNPTSHKLDTHPNPTSHKLDTHPFSAPSSSRFPTPFPTQFLNTDLSRIVEKLDHYTHIATQLAALAKSQPASIQTMQSLLQNIDKHLQNAASVARADVMFGGSARYLAVTIAGHLYRLPKAQHREYCQLAQPLLLAMFEKSTEYFNALKQALSTQEV